MLNIHDYISADNLEAKLSELMDRLHIEGPVESGMLEALSYFKFFHGEYFERIEDKIISMLGLYYKNISSDDLYSYIMSGVGRRNKVEYGEYLTPVQASVRRAIDNNRFISISAPTSSGKSFSIRDFIADSSADAVIVVPSRALIAEFVEVMKSKFDGNKNVMITSFVDDVFKSRSLRHIFVLTPERMKDLYQADNGFDIGAFFFDEAQLSEDVGRGVIFDSSVRRVEKFFPNAKLIFAHPFVDNPQAQFEKHGFKGGFSSSYRQGTVGKIFIQQHTSNKKFYYFSPYSEKGHLLNNCFEYEGDFKDFAFNGVNTVMIFVSKNSLYNGKYIEEFRKYISVLPDVESEDALKIINTIEELIGANDNNHISELVSLLKKGVIIHHGSMPLEVRFLVESLIRERHAKVCFATSTLAQGINMPFDIVWLHNMRIMGDSDKERSLSFKNLIGRAGRLTDESKFDYGYVFTKSPKLLSLRVNDSYELNKTSVLEDYPEDKDGDYYEFVDSIRNDTFDYNLELPLVKADRLNTPLVFSACSRILNLIFSDIDLKNVFRGDGNKKNRDQVKEDFELIYTESLGRKLFDGELAVFNKAVEIFLLVIQGWSFREIVGFRYSEISKDKYGTAGFSQPASKLPDSKLTRLYSLFKDVESKNVSYDVVVYDTYDYLDLVLSFSLNDAFIGAFKIYQKNSEDLRAHRMILLLRYGTMNETIILLIRYGFSMEDVYDLEKYVESISEENIVFTDEIFSAPSYIKNMVKWYLP